MKLRLLLSLIFILACMSPLAQAVEPPVTTQQTGTDQAVEEIFGLHEPGSYKARQGGPLMTRDGTKGYYLIMADPGAKVLALVADIREAGNVEGKLLKKGNLDEVTAHLFRNYIGVGQAFEVDVRDHERIRLSNGKHGVARMAVKFADGFVEPDLILRLDYPNDRTVLLLLGMPDVGVWNSYGNFSDAYVKMEMEAREIISETTLSHKLLPSERYILWRLREIFWP